MAVVETRAQQQENGNDIWLMMCFSGPFKVSVDRTWVLRDKRKVLKNTWSTSVPPVISVCTQALISVCTQALLQAIGFHSLSLVLNSANMGQRNVPNEPINKGK